MRAKGGNAKLLFVLYTERRSSSKRETAFEPSFAIRILENF